MFSNAWRSVDLFHRTEQRGRKLGRDAGLKHRIRKMIRFGRLLLPSLAVLAAAASQARADGEISTFVDEGTIILDGRYRYEHVDQQGFADDADAHTVRLRAGFETGKVWDLQGLVEFEGVLQLNDDFNDTVNGNVTFPVVADPEDLQINRLQIEYSGLPQTAITVGRQRINFDNQRFVGGVAFRQNEQTFDAVRVTNSTIAKLTATYIFVDRVNRIFGEESTQGSFEGATHLLNAAYDFGKAGKLTGYAYWLDLEDAPLQSNETFGLRLVGQQELEEVVTFSYAFEAAKQSEYGDNPRSFDLNYAAAEFGFGYDDFGLAGGFELLEGDGTIGFSTPLGTLHKFQGFADVFLNTPASGILERYARASYGTTIAGLEPLTGVSVGASYHDFRADVGEASFGSEVDLELAARFAEHFATTVTYADFDGDGSFDDVDKFWFSVDVSY